MFTLSECSTNDFRCISIVVTKQILIFSLEVLHVLQSLDVHYHFVVQYSCWQKVVLCSDIYWKYFFKNSMAYMYILLPLTLLSALACLPLDGNSTSALCCCHLYDYMCTHTTVIGRQLYSHDMKQAHYSLPCLNLVSKSKQPNLCTQVYAFSFMNGMVCKL